mgnify:CR=1 FL=1
MSKDTERSRQGAYRHRGSFTCVALGPKGPLWVAISQTVPKPYNSSYLPNRCELGALPCTKDSPPSCASFSSRGRAAARAPPFPIFPFPPPLGRTAKIFLATHLNLEGFLPPWGHQPNSGPLYMFTFTADHPRSASPIFTRGPFTSLGGPPTLPTRPPTHLPCEPLTLPYHYRIIPPPLPSPSSPLSPLPFPICPSPRDPTLRPYISPAPP